MRVPMSREVERGGAEGCGLEERSRRQVKRRRAGRLIHRRGEVEVRWVIIATTKQVIS